MTIIISSYTAKMLDGIVHSLEAGIADVNASFK